jgi:hypothetical protein
MRKILLTLIVVGSLAIVSNTLQAQDYKLGIGLRLSTPTPTLSNSVSIKYFITDKNAVEGLISYGNHFGIGGLYELHRPINATPGLKWFYGGGGYLGFDSDHKTYLGPTGVVGLDYKFEKIPLNLSLDWKPELDILPGINFIPDAIGLSARFTLK